MSNTKQNLTLFSGVTAPTAAPSAVTDGVDLGQMRHPNAVVCLIHNTAGSGSLGVTARAWAYHPATAKWHVLGTDATAGNRGLLNEASEITSISAGVIAHAEIVSGLRGFSRLFVQLTAAFTGSPTVTCVVATRDLGNR